jgi:hypothetical protein
MSMLALKNNAYNQICDHLNMTEQTGTLFGEQPAPRVLFVYDNDNDLQLARKAAEALSDEIPTSRIINSAELDTVRQTSFNLAVVLGSMSAIHPSMHVLQLGGDWVTGVVAKAGSMASFQQVYRRGVSVSTEWVIPGGLDETTERLVREDLLPLVPRGVHEPNDYTGSTATVERGSGAFAVRIDLPAAYHPTALLIDRDRKLFAVKLEREPDSQIWHWSLPERANAIRWTRYVLRELNGIVPAHFPLLSNWQDDPKYMTPAETAASNGVANLESDAAEYAFRLKRQKAGLTSALAQARQAAETGPRQIVRLQGHALVNPVAEALRGIGFVVSKSDDVAKPGDLLEDLQVNLDEETEDTALVEVRAYTGGAALNDLLRMGRFVERYITKHGQPPARRWYITNQFVGKPPSDRSKPLASNPAEVASFAESDGLVIDTSDLLELWMRVQRGELRQDAARDQVWESTGYYELP